MKICEIEIDVSQPEKKRFPMMRVRIYETMTDGPPWQREVGQIMLSPEGHYTIHPTTSADAKLCHSVATKPVPNEHGVTIQPHQTEAFLQNLARAYSGSYLRVSKVEQA
jgi:hypothetical protein